MNDESQAAATAEVPSIDGRFRITVEENGTAAFIDKLTPHTGNGSPVTASDVMARLKKQKVVHGIRSDVVDRLLTQLADGIIPEDKVAIAEWNPPEEGTDASIHWLIDTGAHNLQARYVVPGQIIAIKTPAVPGAAGKTIFGRAKQPAQRPADIPLKAGDGIQLKTSKAGTQEFTAKVLGFACLYGDSLMIKSAITIAEDGLEARMAIYPTSGGESAVPVSADHILSSIKATGIKHGVKEDRIRALIARADFQSLKELPSPKPVPLTIAQGLPATNGKDGELDWLVEPGDTENPAFVLPGQLLLTRTGPTQETEGKDIFGRVLKASAGESLSFEFDPDAIELRPMEDREEFYARCLGQLVCHNGQLTISSGFSIASDGLEATLELFAVSSGRSSAPLTLEHILAFITANGVQTGIDEDTIQKRLSQLQQLPPDDKPSMPVVVARGIAPVPGVDASLELDHRLTKGKMLPDGRIDFHEHSYPWNVSTGEVIGVHTHAVPQQDGLTVTGEVIPALEPKSIDLELEAVIEKENGVLVAERSGSLLVSRTRLCVTDCVIINSDVSQETGHVRAKAAIVINGFVTAGFIADSERGDVLVKHNVEDGVITAFGNVIIHGGVRGENCRITAGNEFSAGFAEQADIMTQSSLSIAKHALGCELMSNDRIIVGEKNARKGGLIGGSAHGRNGVEANILGSDSYVKTIVCAGVMPETQGQLEGLIKDAEDKANALVQYDNAIFQQSRDADGAENNEELIKAQQMRDALLDELDMMYAEMDIVEASLEEPAEPKIIVHYKTYPGVSLRIGNATLKIAREQGPGVFELKDDKIQFTPQ